MIDYIFERILMVCVYFGKKKKLNKKYNQIIN